MHYLLDGSLNFNFLSVLFYGTYDNAHIDDNHMIYSTVVRTYVYRFFVAYLSQQCISFDLFHAPVIWVC